MKLIRPGVEHLPATLSAAPRVVANTEHVGAGSAAIDA